MFGCRVWDIRLLFSKCECLELGGHLDSEHSLRPRIVSSATSMVEPRLT